MNIETAAHSLAIDITGLPDPILYQADELISIKSRADFKAVRYLRKFRNVKKRSVTDMDLPTHLVAASEVTVGDWLLLPRRQNLPPTTLTPDQLYTAGFWLAEGHYVKGHTKAKTHGQIQGVALTNTDRSYLEKMQVILCDWFPTSASHIRTENLKNPKHSTKYVLEFRSRDAANFFYPTFGEYSNHKFIAPNLFDCSGLLPLICGFIDGDGCQISKGKATGQVRMITTSQQLVYQLRQILLDEAIWTTLQYKDHNNTKHHRTYWLSITTANIQLLQTANKITYTGVGLRQNYAIPTPEGFYARVKKITPLQVNT